MKIASFICIIDMLIIEYVFLCMTSPNCIITQPIVAMHILAL
jgi:hypothetical protein